MSPVINTMVGASNQANIKLQTLQDSEKKSHNQSKAVISLSSFISYLLSRSLGNGKHLTENRFRHILKKINL